MSSGPTQRVRVKCTNCEEIYATEVPVPHSFGPSAAPLTRTPCPECGRLANGALELGILSTGLAGKS